MTIKHIIKQGFEFLEVHENSLLDCEVILANVLGVDKEYLIAHSDQEIGGESEFGDDLIELFWAYLKKVKEGQPVAYILKEKEFYGLNFYVDNRVLVPRPETELLVETVLNYLEGSDSEKFRILDVGTGSGNIAISLAANFQDLEVTALDLSEEALEVARVNVDQHGVEDRVQLAQSDLLDVVEEGENYHVIVANLPYIGIETNSDVDENVRKHEPKAALFAGADGLVLYKKMFQQIKDKNLSYNMIVGEFGSMQQKDMADLLNNFFEQKWRIEKDLAGFPRMFVINDR
ncbi:peptide chain release factor N(5)-glutamine methyltransferase [Candidatus Peregrinibacteria bacterium]|nr:peptide chain release factor N(5)-glutamine methyltransferase [Candidatus Peregrinibacteria bacterium]